MARSQSAGSSSGSGHFRHSTIVLCGEQSLNDPTFKGELDLIRSWQKNGTLRNIRFEFSHNFLLFAQSSPEKQIVHISAHGFKGVFTLKGQNDAHCSVRHLLGSLHKSVELVIVHACQSANGVVQDDYTTKSVIVCDQKARPESFTTFTNALYHRLDASDTIQEAFDYAQSQLISNHPTTADEQTYRDRDKFILLPRLQEPTLCTVTPVCHSNYFFTWARQNNMIVRTVGYMEGCFGIESKSVDDVWQKLTKQTGEFELRRWGISFIHVGDKSQEYITERQVQALEKIVVAYDTIDKAVRRLRKAIGKFNKSQGKELNGRLKELEAKKSKDITLAAYDKADNIYSTHDPDKVKAEILSLALSNGQILTPQQQKEYDDRKNQLKDVDSLVRRGKRLMEWAKHFLPSDRVNDYPIPHDLKYIDELAEATELYTGFKVLLGRTPQWLCNGPHYHTYVNGRKLAVTETQQIDGKSVHIQLLQSQTSLTKYATAIRVAEPPTTVPPAAHPTQEEDSNEDVDDLDSSEHEEKSDADVASDASTRKRSRDTQISVHSESPPHTSRMMGRAGAKVRKVVGQLNEAASSPAGLAITSALISGGAYVAGEAIRSSSTEIAETPDEFKVRTNGLMSGRADSIFKDVKEQKWQHELVVEERKQQQQREKEKTLLQGVTMFDD